MLMKTRLIDFHEVEEHQWAIDQKLRNWARWLKPGRQSWMSPMFAQYRSKAWQWERPAVADPINILEAADMEKAVSALPDKHKHAIRWAYYFQSSPSIAFRVLGVNRDGLMLLIRDGRQMLINRQK